jgi:hypothetical protein
MPTGRLVARGAPERLTPSRGCPGLLHAAQAQTSSACTALRGAALTHGGGGGGMCAPGVPPGARQFVSLWELPAARFEGASVAALHGGGYRAVQAEAAEPAGCVCRACAGSKRRGADAWPRLRAGARLWRQLQTMRTRTRRRWAARTRGVTRGLPRWTSGARTRAATCTASTSGGAPAAARRSPVRCVRARRASF